MFTVIFFITKGDKDTPICGIANLDCVDKVEEEVMERMFLNSMIDIDSDEQYCNCLPSCDSIDYDLETSSAKFDSAKWMRLFDLQHNQSANTFK